MKTQTEHTQKPSAPADKSAQHTRGPWHTEIATQTIAFGTKDSVIRNLWDEKTKTYVLPTGTVKQGRKSTKAERAARLAAIADKVYAASELDNHDCPKCGEHFSTCICEDERRRPSQK